MVPEVNATWTGEGSRVLSNIDIATAVATEGGLITPIVKNAVGLGLQEISAIVKVLASQGSLCYATVPLADHLCRAGE